MRSTDTNICFWYVGVDVYLTHIRICWCQCISFVGVSYLFVGVAWKYSSVLSPMYSCVCRCEMYVGVRKGFICWWVKCLVWCVVDPFANCSVLASLEVEGLTHFMPRMVSVPACTNFHTKRNDGPTTDGVDCIFAVFIELTEMRLFHILLPWRCEFDAH